MMTLYRKYDCLPYQYLKNGLYVNRFTEPVEDFMPPRIIYDYVASLAPQTGHRVIRDKRAFRERLEARGLPVIREVFAIMADGVIKEPSGRDIDQAEARALLDAHDGDLFVKPVDANQGRGAHVRRASDFDADFFASHRNFLVQPRVIQHPVLDRLYPHSVNSVRIDCLHTEAGWISNAAVLRVGTGGSVIDNYSAGGIVVGIDLDTGRLRPIARMQPRFGSSWHARHPDTGVAFGDIMVPHWDLLRDTLNRAAEAMLPFVSLGWDLAVTPDGVILIEANGNWDVNVFQIAWGGLGRTEVGRRAMRHRAAVA
jgi:hypothetical protein